MNVKIFGGFIIFAGILFMGWGCSGCMNHGASMGTIESISSNREAGTRNFLIGTGLVFLGIALSAAGRKRPKDTDPSSDSATEHLSGWECRCGRRNLLRDEFCPECGSPKADSGWQCECGQISYGSAKHCSKCGRKRSSHSE